MAKKVKIRSKNTSPKTLKQKPPLKSKDIPVTQNMLFEARNELKSDIRGTHFSIKSLEKKVDARFNQVDARFNQVDARFNQMDASFAKLMSEVHRIGLLVEDQNARNKYVLDGYTSLNDRLDKQAERHDQQFLDIKKSIDSI